MKRFISFFSAILLSLPAFCSDSLTVFYRIRIDQDIDQSSQRLVTSGLEKALASDADYVMLDLEAYINTTLRANADYAEEQRTGDLSRHTRKALKNTAASGIFSSDRTIQEYSDEIWHLEPVKQ